MIRRLRKARPARRDRDTGNGNGNSRRVGAIAERPAARDRIGPPVRIDEELRTLLPPLDDGQMKALAAKIKAEGFVHPLAVWRHDGKLVLLDGHHRLQLCERLKKPYTVHEVPGIHTTAEAARWVVRNQSDARRNLNTEQRTEIALALERIYGVEARGRQREAGKRHGRGQQLGSSQPPSYQPKPRAPKAAEQAGHDMHVSTRTMRQLDELKAKADPEVLERIRRGTLSIGKAHRQLKAREPQRPWGSARPRPPIERDHVRGVESYTAKRQSARRLQAIVNMATRIEEQLDVPADKMVKALDDLFRDRAALLELVEQAKSTAGAARAAVAAFRRAVHRRSIRTTLVPDLAAAIDTLDGLVEKGGM